MKRPTSMGWFRCGLGFVLAVIGSFAAAMPAIGNVPLPSAGDMVALQTIEEQRLSPDGGQVAYVQREIASAGGKRPRHIWLADYSGNSAPRKATPGFASALEPRWSPPDSGHPQIAFFGESDIGAGARSPRQLWLLTPATGEVRQVKAQVAGASQLEWVPGTRWVSFIRIPEPLAVSPGAPLVVGRSASAARLWITDTLDGNTWPVSPEGFTVRKYAWSPDGAVAVIAAVVDGPDGNAEQILSVSRSGGPPRRLMTAHDDTISLAWSPDGDTIAWLGREHEPGSGQIMLLNASGEPRPRTLLADFPGSALWLGYHPDGRLVMAALRGVRIGVFSFREDGSDLRTDYDPRALLPGTLCGEDLARFALSFSRDGFRWSTTVSGPHEPGNVVAGRWGRSLRRITDLNPQVRHWELGQLETLRWRGRDGLELEGLLLKPPGWRPGQRYPTIVHPHGGPRRSWWAGWLFNASAWGQFFASRGYLVFLPNPRGSEGYGAEFVRANQADLGGADWQDIMAGADFLVTQGVADPERLAIAGWSYGGYLTARGITQTARFKAAIVGAGVTDLTSFEGAGGFPLWSHLFWRDASTPYRKPHLLVDRSPVHHAGRISTPTLLFHGTADEKVPPSQMIELHTALSVLGVPVQAVLYPGAGHGLTDASHVQDMYVRMEEWLQRYLPVQ